MELESHKGKKGGNRDGDTSEETIFIIHEKLQTVHPRNSESLKKGMRTYTQILLHISQTND